MLQQILDAVIPVAVAALVGVLVTLIKAAGSALVSLIQQKQQELEIRIGTSQYQQYLAFAKAAWNIVDEYFRITPGAKKTIEAAQEKFAEEIKKMVPAITDEQIDELRQAVAGEINQGRAALTSGTAGAGTDKKSA